MDQRPEPNRKRLLGGGRGSERGLPAPASQLGDKADFTPSPLKGQAATGAA